ncbi:MAG: patatin-like phospholipase family protein [Candidatus Schekmanbacteria bacterium]|nr:patatin-like phospholipase family protein [Candidatus Schekmanbacteria bacterium]
MKVALVLSGGGARGAYEAGILRYLLCDLSAHLGDRLRLDVIVGTSVGAINGIWIAGRGLTSASARQLSDVWCALRSDQIFRFGARDLVRLPRLLRGGSRRPNARQVSLLDPAPLRELIYHRLPWEGMRRRLFTGEVEAIVISATEIATGRSIHFVDHHRGSVPGFMPYDVADLLPVRLTPLHCLASAAIPFFFPPVDLGGNYFVDGALRQNTPLSPALRLGADRVLVIGVKRSFRARRDAALEKSRDRPPNLVFLLGKALNALTLDSIEEHLMRLEQFNTLLSWGATAFGSTFLERLNAVIAPVRGAPYRHVRTCYMRPSEDIGCLATTCFRKSKVRANWSTRKFYNMIGPDPDELEADLLSYLLFDRCYTAEIEKLGWEDARRNEEALVQFFTAADDDRNHPL